MANSLRYTTTVDGRKLLLFYGHNEKTQGDMAIFSNWYPSLFSDKDGVRYENTEQHMMRYKALTFGDEKAAEEMMKTTDPAVHKRLGRQVKGYDDDIWSVRSQEVVYEGNYLKFSQSRRLKQLLLSTGDALLVEASPSDARWGIGLKAEAPEARDPSKWRGTNWLGIALMRVRDRLRQEEENKK